VDQSLAGIKHYRIDTRDPEVEKRLRRERREAEPRTLSAERNESIQKRIERFPELADFYNEYDDLDVTDKELEDYAKLKADLEAEDKELLESGLNFYVFTVKDVGGIPMPVTLGLDYDDGTSEEVRVPVEVWRRNPEEIEKLVITKKTLVRAVLDPHLEIADADLTTNRWPTELEAQTIQLQDSGSFGRRGRGGPNPMREAQEAEKKKAEGTKAPVEAGAGSEAGADSGGGR